MLLRERFPALIAGMLALFALAGGAFYANADGNGLLQHTGRATDLAILGPGYFEVRDVAGRTYFTRLGSFVVDNDGYLVAPTGERVQGRQADLSMLGDMRISFDWASTPVPIKRPDARLAGFRIEADGTITIFLSEGTSYPWGQILLRRLRSPDAGMKFHGGLILDRGELGAAAHPSAPGADGLGLLAVGTLETPAPQITLRGKVGALAGREETVLVGSGIETDLAIWGRGYFTVRDPATGVLYATRAGAFYWDENGFLVNYGGLRVQGYLCGLNELGDIRVEWDLPSRPIASEAPLRARSIDRDGYIRALLTDGTQFMAGQILLRGCHDPASLVRGRFGVYELDLASGAWTDYAPADENGFGLIFVGQQDLTQMDADLVAARQQMNFVVQGNFRFTNRPTDCYLDGAGGFFTVRDPERNIFHATRDGGFHLDAENYLVTSDNFRVQGLTEAAPHDWPMELKSGDIKIDAPGDLALVSFRICADGRIRIVCSDGRELDRAQIRLQNYRNPHALVRESNHLYSNLENAAPQFGEAGAEPQTHGLASFIGGAVEDIRLEPGMQMPPPDAMRLTVRNLPMGGIVEASVDLSNWMPLGWVGSTEFDTAEFFDATSTRDAQRFYRVRVPSVQSDAGPVPAQNQSIPAGPVP